MDDREIMAQNLINLLPHRENNDIVGVRENELFKLLTYYKFSESELALIEKEIQLLNERRNHGDKDKSSA